MIFRNKTIKDWTFGELLDVPTVEVFNLNKVKDMLPNKVYGLRSRSLLSEIWFLYCEPHHTGTDYNLHFLEEGKAWNFFHVSGQLEVGFFFAGHVGGNFFKLEEAVDSVELTQNAKMEARKDYCYNCSSDVLYWKHLAAFCSCCNRMILG